MVPLRQPSHERFIITDDTGPGALRRTVSARAERAGATPAGKGRAELVATELATNLLRHAKPGGWVLMRPVPTRAIEFIAVDHGPGIADVTAAIEGKSPSPSGLGTGLAAVRRASSSFDAYSRPGHGTTVLAVVELTDEPPPPPRTWAGVSVGITEVCGDGWAVAALDDGVAVAVVDGLGHGRHASAAADAALATFDARPDDLDTYVARANEAMRSTRGGAATVCRMWPGKLRYVAVGNVSGRLFTAAAQRGLAFSNGTLGVQAAPPKATLVECEWPAGATLVLWTDGLTSRFDLANQPDLLRHDPAVVAATLHRDYSRERDDATVVVVRGLDQP
jgi:anti-sigma regulatory factor (Ser/Thr protein kinase)